MPTACCVLSCNSNSRASKLNEGNISVFTFPSDIERNNEWTKIISNVNKVKFKPTKRSVVCIKHFLEKHIIRENKITSNDGTIQILQRKHLKLLEDAVPCIFPNISGPTPTMPRKTPNERRREQNERDERELAEWCGKDIISDFETFASSFQNRECRDFMYHTFDNYVLFVKIEEIREIPKVAVCFKILKDLSVKCYFNESILPMTNFPWLENGKLSKWSMFDTLLTHLSTFSTNVSLPIKSEIGSISDNLNKLVLRVEDQIITNKEVDLANSEDKLNKLKFLNEQLFLCSASKIHYSTDTIVWAFYIALSFPSAYDMIRNSGLLNLPHPKYLRRLSGNIKSEIGLKPSQIQYLKERCENLQPIQKVVSVIFDEINVQGKLCYRGGRLEGIALDEEKVENAVRIQAFMVSSAFGKYEDIVALYPIKSNSSENLKTCTLQVLKALNEIGFNVLCLICDNHRINRGMYQILCNAKNKREYIVNPFNSQQKVFLLFDTVHLLKSIRNNWLNQKNEEQSFVFPSFNDHQNILCANVHDLKTLHASEENNIVKTAPNLSKKVLYPTIFERQNVLLACKLFDEKVIAALQNKNDVFVEGTAEFIKIIMSWWKIVNVRTPEGGIRLRDPLRDPIKNPNDSNVQFLKDFVQWLNAWENIVFVPDESSPKHTAKLTPDTFSSLNQTCKSIIELIDYVFANIQLKYILLGKLSSDCLEGRFGRYRLMSGSNYNVSVCQVVDSERKLKVLNLLKLESSSLGRFSIKQFNEKQGRLQIEADMNDTPINSALFEDCNFSKNVIFEKSEEISITESESVSLLYIAGYVCHAMIKYMGSCECCCRLVKSGKDMVVEASNVAAHQYLNCITRGGLKEPTEYIHQLVILEFKIFSCLISPEYEEKFTKCEKQREVLKYITRFAFLDYYNQFENQSCSCGRTMNDLINRASHIIANIFLNNYTKMRNDHLSSRNSTDSNLKKRKLQTFN